MGRTCSHCGQDISDLRDDAKFCRSACRQAAYRARQMREQGQTFFRGHVQDAQRPQSQAREGV